MRFTELIAVLAAVGAIQYAYAGPLNITIADGTAGNVFSGASTDSSGEDNETEPGTVQAQSWDLERVVWNQAADPANDTVTIIGGFDFLNGNSGFHSGDIFIDTDGNFTSQPANGVNGYETINGNLGYEFVIHFNGNRGANYSQSGGLDYEVYKLDSSAQLVSGYFDVLSGSSPFVYKSGGTLLPPAPLTAGYSSYANSAAVNAAYSGVSGWVDVQGYGGVDTHYDLTVSIGWLASQIGYQPDTLHMTLGCGNDEIRGQFRTGALIQTPDGGMTVMLLGLSLTSLAFIRRKIAG